MVEQTPTSLALRLILALLGVVIVVVSRIFTIPPISFCAMLIGIAFVVASLTTK